VDAHKSTSVFANPNETAPITASSELNGNNVAAKKLARKSPNRPYSRINSNFGTDFRRVLQS